MIDLRHSCASFLLAAGALPRTVMKTLGHSQIGLTMNTYTYVLPEIGRGVIDAAARVIFERRASRKPWLHSWLHCGRPGRIYESPDWA